MYSCIVLRANQVTKIRVTPFAVNENNEIDMGYVVMGNNKAVLQVYFENVEEVRQFIDQLEDLQGSLMLKLRDALRPTEEELTPPF